MGGNDINQFHLTGFGVNINFNSLNAEAVGRGNHAFAVRGIMPAADNGFAVASTDGFANDIVVRNFAFRSVSQINPAVADIQVMNNVDAHLGGREFDNLAFGISRGHLTGVAVHQGLTAAPGAEVGGTNCGISRVDTDIGKFHPEFFGGNHAESCIRTLADVAGAGE